MYRAIVKATTVNEAGCYAAAHGLRTVSVHAVIPERRNVVLVVEAVAGEDTGERLGAWFGEPGGCVAGYGYAPGSLLWYAAPPSMGGE